MKKFQIFFILILCLFVPLTTKAKVLYTYLVGGASGDINAKISDGFGENTGSTSEISTTAVDEYDKGFYDAINVLHDPNASEEEKAAAGSMLTDLLAPSGYVYSGTVPDGYGGIGIKVIRPREYNPLAQVSTARYNCDSSNWTCYTGSGDQSEYDYTADQCTKICKPPPPCTPGQTTACTISDPANPSFSGCPGTQTCISLGVWGSCAVDINSPLCSYLKKTPLPTTPPPTTPPPPPPCLIDSFNITPSSRTTLLGFNFTASWDTNGYCTNCTLSCGPDGCGIVAGGLSVSSTSGTLKITPTKVGSVYSYTLDCMNTSSSDSKTLGGSVTGDGKYFKVINPFWRETPAFLKLLVDKLFQR